MILIADSGSTKTAWCLCNGSYTHYVMSQGINPYQQTEEEICAVLSHELVPQIEEYARQKGIADCEQAISDIFFYGAGCTLEKSSIVASALRQSVSLSARISVESDMLGAARGLCGHKAGIVCILGTGSNSCYYTGKEIIANVSPLGYILGDEGSGAYIGKRLVGDILKHQLPEDVCALFFEETHETAATIIQKVYREALPNRFLASLSPFCARHRDIPAVHSFIKDCFIQFFIRNIRAYSNHCQNGNTTKVHFIGSIAHFYREELTEAANECGFEMGTIAQAPLEGLVAYHTA